MNSNHDIATFYNGFGRRLLRDYVYGNRRVKRAVDRVCNVIQNSHSSILDIGCGIGTSSYLYRQLCPWVSVHGVDISPENVSIAESLFGGPGIAFSVSAMESPPTDAAFDVVAMIDVYEHLPRAKWPSFNEILAKCLAPDGVVVMTTPSPFHQAYLAEHDPAALQIVDECVELDDVLKLREDIEGTLTCLQFVDVWKRHDYVHVVIERDPQYGPQQKRHERGSLWERIRSRLADEKKRERKTRRDHVKRVLGIDLE